MLRRHWFVRRKKKRKRVKYIHLLQINTEIGLKQTKKVGKKYISYLNCSLYCGKISLGFHFTKGKTRSNFPPWRGSAGFFVFCFFVLTVLHIKTSSFCRVSELTKHFTITTALARTVPSLLNYCKSNYSKVTTVPYTEKLIVVISIIWLLFNKIKISKLTASIAYLYTTSLKLNL